MCPCSFTCILASHDGAMGGLARLHTVPVERRGSGPMRVANRSHLRGYAPILCPPPLNARSSVIEELCFAQVRIPSSNSHWKISLDEDLRTTDMLPGNNFIVAAEQVSSLLVVSQWSRSWTCLIPISQKSRGGCSMKSTGALCSALRRADHRRSCNTL